MSWRQKQIDKIKDETQRHGERREDAENDKEKAAALKSGATQT
jgi:hypothetical protein